MEQATFAELEHDTKKRRTRRELFLEKMDGLIPWERLEGRIEPFYPKAGRGRRPYPLGVMLRVHCVRLFYNLSDPGTGGSAVRGGVGAPGSRACGCRGPCRTRRRSCTSGTCWSATASARRCWRRSTRTWRRWATG